MVSEIITVLTCHELSELVESAVERAIQKRLPEQPQPIPAPAPCDDYLSRDEVCRLLRISVSTVYERERDGSLVPRRVGRRVLYRRSDVERMLDGINGNARRHGGHDG